MTGFVEGARVRFKENPDLAFQPDGILDGWEGTLLACLECWDGTNEWNVEFPQSPFGYIQLRETEMEVIT